MLKIWGRANRLWKRGGDPTSLLQMHDWSSRVTKIISAINFTEKSNYNIAPEAIIQQFDVTSCLMYNTLIFSQKRETTSFKHLWVDILIFPDFFKLFNSFQLRATSIARICVVWLSDELWGGLRLCSKIPNFSLLEYIALQTQRVQDCLTKTNPWHRHWQEQHEPWP